MKRDMDLVRTILLEIEKEANEFKPSLQELDIQDHESGVIIYHLDIMIQAGLIEGTIELYIGGDSSFVVEGLTWQGHDFLDTVRDAEVWAKTKAGADIVRSWSFDTLKDIGKGLIKKQVEEWTGVKVG